MASVEAFIGKAGLCAMELFQDHLGLVIAGVVIYVVLAGDSSLFPFLIMKTTYAFCAKVSLEKSFYGNFFTSKF
jgi:hypothetical protein